MLRSLMCLAWLLAVPASAQPPVVIEDFEQSSLGAWHVEGTAFGTEPATGAVDGQQTVRGFLGERFANSFHGEDASTGEIVSPTFAITHPYLNFLIGGGNHPHKTAVNLVVDGSTTRTATGINNERLCWQAWDVRAQIGSTARLQVVDRHTGGWGHINADHFELSEVPRVKIHDHDALTRAMGHLQSISQEVLNDPARPIFHVMPPAQWCNDPNAPLFHDGWYHLFYQHNPYDDVWGSIHWGHVRGRDLVTWEHLPIALYPHPEDSEEMVWSGCAAKDAGGQPILFYTSIGPDRAPQDAAVQCVAFPRDNELITWDQRPANPVLTEELHGDLKVHEWRDPFVFEHAGDTFMVLGGYLREEDRGVVTLYRSASDDLLSWDFLGILFRHPNRGLGTLEVPLFFPLADQWVLTASRRGGVDEFVGRFDTETWTFHADHRFVINHGNYYAPNAMIDPQGRRIMWGWVSPLVASGVPPGRGWNGSLTVPRVLVWEDGVLKHRPLPGLEKLRGDETILSATSIDAGTTSVALPDGGAFELDIDLQLASATRMGLRLQGPAGDTLAEVAYSPGHLQVHDIGIDASPGGVVLQVLVDRSVIEVFVNRGRDAVTRVIMELHQATTLEFFADGGTGILRTGSLWPMETIWQEQARKPNTQTLY